MNLRPIRTVLAVAEPNGEQRRQAGAWDVLYAQAHAQLLKRIEEHGAPDPDQMPTQDLVLIYRLPNQYAGRVIIPDTAEGGHDAPYSIGLLIAAGCEAQDVLESHGTLPGDLVTFAQYAGQEEESGRVQEAIRKGVKAGATPELAEEIGRQMRAEEMAKKKLLRFQVPFVHGSVDLLERLYGERPTMERVREVDAKGRPVHVYRPIVEALI